jgi:hypothetical protein
VDWKQLMAYITGSVDEELLLGNEYLVTENHYSARTLVLTMGYTAHLWEHRLAAAFKDQASVFPERELRR